MQTLWEHFELQKCGYLFKNTFNLGENVRIIFVYILNILPNSTKKKFPIIPYSLVIFVECHLQNEVVYGEVQVSQLLGIRVVTSEQWRVAPGDGVGVTTSLCLSLW